MVITGIQTISPALLQSTREVGLVAPTAFANPPSTTVTLQNCVINDNHTLASCDNFAPISNFFRLYGIFTDNSTGQQTTYGFLSPFSSSIVETSPLIYNLFTSQIGSSTPLQPPTFVNVCGRQGFNPDNSPISGTYGPSFYTTQQRMFDCYQQNPIYFAGKGNGDGTAMAFTIGIHPELNWFMVSCYDTTVEHCSWLTPAIPASPATGANEFTSTYTANLGNPPMPTKVSATPTSNLVGKRFLWSGLIAGNYNFFQANGGDPWYFFLPSTMQGVYDYYPFILQQPIAESSIHAKQQLFAPSTYSNCGTGTPPIVCISSLYNSAYIPNATTLSSICESKTGIDNSLISATPYFWQMPSYPMIMMITGGGSLQLCSSGNGSVCLSTAVGLRAADAVPSFQTPFWSSSAAVQSSGWFFDSGSVDFRLNFGFGTSFGVRCVSLDW